MKSKRLFGSRRFLSTALLFTAALMVIFPSWALSQSSSPAGGSASGSPVKPKSLPPRDEEDDSTLLWFVAGGIIVALGVGGVVAWKVMEKRPRRSSSGLREAITPEKGVMLGGYRFQGHIMT